MGDMWILSDNLNVMLIKYDAENQITILMLNLYK